MRRLSFHLPSTPKTQLAELAEWTSPDVKYDGYGQGDVVTEFEAEIAQLLGKEAAVFMPSGTMAQQIALRIWCDRRQIHTVAFHPTAHLEIHEQKAYEHLHGLKAVLVGSPTALMTLDEVQQIEEPLGAFLIELPQREIGGQLPTWDELIAITEWARNRKIALHLDGARLWQCKSFYRREYAEIAALFDTVYVSFYKDLGAIAGAMLTGPTDVIEEAKIWQRRHGGNLVRLFPYVLSAKKGLEAYLPRMEAYYAKMQEVAAALAQFPEIQFMPLSPHTNMAHIYLAGSVDAYKAAGEHIKETLDLELFWGVREGAIPDHVMFETTFGESALQLEIDEIVSAFELLLEKAKEHERNLSLP